MFQWIIKLGRSQHFLLYTDTGDKLVGDIFPAELLLVCIVLGAENKNTV